VNEGWKYVTLLPQNGQHAFGGQDVPGPGKEGKSVNTHWEILLTSLVTNQTG